MQPDPGWSAGPPCGAPDEGLHQTFAHRARSRPDAVALRSGRHATTYAQLDRAADAWAARLAAAGVGPGDQVPILLPRGTELVTALLAVLKTGAAYALLDPTWPAVRLRAVVDELTTPLVISRSGAVDPAIPPVWSPPGEPTAVAPDFRPVAVAGSAPCCVFLTSGTTGRPKAVLTPHRATARLFQPEGFARFTTETVLPLAAPVPWDAFSLELWSVLLTGGTSLIVDEPYLSAQALRNGITRHGVDTTWLTSSLFNMIVDEDPDAFTGLRQVMIGGERLSTAHVRRFLRRHPTIDLLNGYGPVENTVFATTHRITAADCELPGGIPLGRPVPGTRVYVLAGARPCAVGQTGEICIAGDGLALRYLGDPARTDAKFTQVSIDGRAVRVYRTGDLGTWGSDGLLHFRGRADRQLKIRGHRIEPVEVERQVERLLPSVRACRVLARTDDAGVPRELVAFCVPTEPGDPLRDALPVLNSALVPYHRPADVVSVDAFPLTAQGKLDERALLAIAPVGRPSTTEPPTEEDDPPDGAEVTVRLVAETFCSVLGRTAVPHGVPFVALGGNSLGAGRVCARLGARLGRPVPVSRLYQHPTVTALAGWLRSTARPAARTAVARTAVARTAVGAAAADVPLTPMQTVYLTRHLVVPVDRTAHCLLTWVVEGVPDRAALESAIAAVHRRHEPLRAAYVPDPRPAARLVDIVPPPLELLADQPSVDAAIRALRAELAEELEPTEADVWRVALVTVRAGEQAVLGCVVHHIAFDGWSASVLAEDLAQAYNATLRDEEPTAAPPPSLATVHREHHARLADTDLAARSDHLLDELAGVPDLRWPDSVPEPAPGAPVHLEVPLAPSVVDDVDAMAAEAGVTRFVVLLSRYARSLAELTGQRDFAVGVPVAQRDGAGLERAVGCHINMLCVRLRGIALDGGTAGVVATGRIVERAFAAQDVPFADVLRLVNPPRSDRPPLYQTLFALQDNAIPRLDLAGLPTRFVRQPYLDLPLELHTELWPEQDGGLRLEISFRPDAVRESTVQEFAKRFTDRLHASEPGVLP